MLLSANILYFDSKLIGLIPCEKGVVQVNFSRRSPGSDLTRINQSEFVWNLMKIKSPIFV